jgi:hypothetical protein
MILGEETDVKRTILTAILLIAIPAFGQDKIDCRPLVANDFIGSNETLVGSGSSTMVCHVAAPANSQAQGLRPLAAQPPQAHSPATILDAQENSGMYLDRDGEPAQKMERARMSGSESKGVAKSVFVPGASVSHVWDYPGAEATIHADASPRFIYYLHENQTIADRDFVMVRMDQKSDRREIRVAKQGAWTGDVRTGFDRKRLVDLRITKKGSTVEIVPMQTLTPGEYFMTAGFSPVGYDFGVHK